MLVYMFLLVTFYLILFLFLALYFYYKTKYAFQAFQQSAYNVGRYINYIKDNYKYTFGINELLLLIIIFIFSNAGLLTNPLIYLLQIFLLIFFTYYNLKFFNISKGRYTEKLTLKLTNRVKRLLVTFSLVSIILFVLLTILFGPIFALVTVTYIVYPIIMLSSYINKPIEKMYYNKFKKDASLKLAEHKNICVIGITGSYGKTSIKNIVYDVLSPHEITLKTPESYNTPMGVSLTINNDLNKMQENFIVEMGAYYEGEIKELVDMVHPKIGIVSSIGPQHLETFKNIETVQKTKMELIEGLPADGLGILNYDNEYIRNYPLENKVNIKWYSLENKDVDLYAYDIVYKRDGMKFNILFNGKEYTIKTSLLGKHNIYNILASILVGDFKGIYIDKIIESVENVNPIKNRLELKKINKELTIIDDAFNGNVEGIKEGINILSNMDSKKILITPGVIDGGKYNDDLNKEIAQSIKNIDLLVVIGQYNKKVFEENLAKDVEVEYFDNFIDGYNYAIKEQGEKTILIANDLPDKYN